MKYLRKFNEAVILPDKSVSNAQLRTFDDVVDYGLDNDFFVVGYDEFYNSLSEADKKTAPPKHGIPFFALFHPERKKPMFVLCDKNAPRMIPNFREVIDDIIGHEKVHGEQIRRRNPDIDYILPDPMDRAEYFSNKEEIMAFSYTIANGLSKECNNIKAAFNKLEGKDEAPRRGFFRGPVQKAEYARIWDDINHFCEDKVINRYKKYIYQYLEKMFDKGEK